MKLTVRSRDLVRELSLAQGIVEAKTTIPVLGNVLLTAKGDSLQLQCTDLELSIRTSCQATVEEPGSTLIPIRRLFEYARLLPDADLTITVDGSEPVDLECGRAKTRIAAMPDRGVFPELAEVPPATLSIPARVLTLGIQRAIVSVAESTVQYAITAAQFIVRRDAVGFVSTDGHRLTLHVEKREVEGIDDEIVSLMTRKAMSELAKITSDSEGSPENVEFATDEKNLFFRYGKRLLVARKVDGKFPDYKRVLPKDLEISLVLEKDSLTALLRRVKQFASEKGRMVRLDLETGTLKFSASSFQYGTSEESLPVDYEGESFGVGFNADYIIDFLQVCGGDEVLLRIKDPRSAAQFELPGTDDDKDYRYVIMPVRV